MITVRITLDGPSNIPIGQQKTNGAVEVIWDISKWKKTFGDGTVSLLHRRPGESVVYPCNITQQGDEVRWLVNAADTEKCGVGRCWLIYMFGENSNVEKSREYQTYIRKQPTGTNTDPPQVGSDWIAEVISAGNQAKEAARQAEDAVDQLDSVAQNALSQIGEAQIETVGAVKAEGDRQIQRIEEIGLENLVQIDDTDISDTTVWSSEKTVSIHCPSFEVNGSVVNCEPVEGSRLGMIIQIEPVQEGEENLSPENIRPIQGWDSTTIWHGGKNLLGEDLPALDGFIDNASNAIVSSTSQGKTYVVPIKKYGTFTVSVNKTQIIRLATCAFKPYVGASLSTITTATSTYRSITTNSSDRYLLVNLPRVDFGTDEPMFVYGDESSYEPYCGKMIEIPFGQTVYGGTLDVTGGIVTKTHENIPSYAGENVGDDWISSTGSLTDGAQVVYRLPQPEIIQLESTEIIAASGINTVYADTGDVTISGYSDPNAIINSLTERIEALEQNVIGD